MLFHFLKKNTKNPALFPKGLGSRHSLVPFLNSAPQLESLSQVCSVLTSPAFSWALGTALSHGIRDKMENNKVEKAPLYIFWKGPGTLKVLFQTHAVAGSAWARSISRVGAGFLAGLPSSPPVPDGCKPHGKARDEVTGPGADPAQHRDSPGWLFPIAHRGKAPPQDGPAFVSAVRIICLWGSVWEWRRKGEALAPGKAKGS